MFFIYDLLFLRQYPWNFDSDRYHLERRIFQELLELKRLQIRAGRANEQVLVKRLVDEYHKAGLTVGMRQYDGVYSFRSFEKYLYGRLHATAKQFRKLQTKHECHSRF
jgi:hypothetical protein